MRVSCCYLILTAAYLLYAPHAEFVLDDWFLFQKIAQAESQGGLGELAAGLLQNRVWGSFRTNGLSFVGVLALSRIGGARPLVYFMSGLLLHAAIGYLLYLTLARLDLPRRLAFLAGALFLVLPASHHPLFWFPSCAPYLASAALSLGYLYSVAGTVRAGRLTLGAAVAQAVLLAVAALSGDQAFGLLAGGAVLLAAMFRSRAALASAALAWVTLGVTLGLYIGLVNQASLHGSMAAKFEFTLARLAGNLRQIGSGYEYRIEAGWDLAAGLAVGLLVAWLLGGVPGGAQPGSLRAALLGSGLVIVAFAPVAFLRWRELRYEYLPALGLAVLLAAAWRWLGRPGAAALVAFGVASVLADIRQGWIPQSENLRVIRRELGRLRDVRDHDIIAVSGAPQQIGTAPHFAMFLSFSSTPFVETATGVWGLVTGRDITVDSGRLGLEHTDFFRPLESRDLQRTHVIACQGWNRCGVRLLLAREVRPGRFQLHALKEYRGPPIETGRLWSRQELEGGEVYFAPIR